MKLPRRQFLHLTAGAVTLPAASRGRKPTTIVVPFAPGGGTDVAGRIMAEQMRATLGLPVIVENV
jgi:tripartite-type tricarboxylate transporter receptor subunit TctC